MCGRFCSACTLREHPISPCPLSEPDEGPNGAVRDGFREHQVPRSANTPCLFVGCSQNPLTCENATLVQECPQVKRGSTHSRSDARMNFRRERQEQETWPATPRSRLRVAGLIDAEHHRAGSGRYLGALSPGPAHYGPIGPTRMARSRRASGQPVRSEGRLQTPAREVSGHVCRSDHVDQRGGRLLRSLHLRDQQSDPSLEGAPRGTDARADEALSHARPSRWGGA